MIELLRKALFHNTLKKYLFIGLLNTFLTIALIFLLKWSINLNDIVANIFGYSAGLIFSFFANKKWTFNFIGKNQLLFIKFLLVFCIAYLCNLFIMIICLNYFNSYISHIFGMPAYTLVGYLGNRFFTFRKFKYY